MVLGDQKGRGVPPHNKCEHTPFSLCTGIHLGKMCTHVGRDLDRPGMPKKWDNWSEENKDPEEVPCVSDLNHLYGILLLIRADAHTLSLQVYTSALLLSQINKLLLCVLFHFYWLVLENYSTNGRANISEIPHGRTPPTSQEWLHEQDIRH